jgi:hypothetical protein
LPIELVFPPDMLSRYVNHCVIQWGEHECKIVFFEVDPPMLMGSQEEKAEQAKQLSSVKARCVGRFVLAKEFVPIFVKILTETTAIALTLHESDEKKTGT